MSLDSDLLSTAELLLRHTTKRPRGSDLRRAVSTSYYAMFHALARVAADGFIGAATQGRTERAWRRTYRALNHRQAAKRCTEVFETGEARGFPEEVIQFAEQFEKMMDRRHDADYDPSYRPTKEDAAKQVALARAAIRALDAASVRDRRALAAFVLFSDR